MNLSNTNSFECAPHSHTRRPSHHVALNEFEHITAGYDEERQVDQLLIRDHDSFDAIPQEKIDFVEAVGDYIQINSEGKGYLKAQRLADFQTQLDSALFLEIHPTCVVHVSRLPDVDDGLDGWTVLKDGSLVPVSSEGRNAILRMRGLAVR